MDRSRSPRRSLTDGAVLHRPPAALILDQLVPPVAPSTSLTVSGPNVRYEQRTSHNVRTLLGALEQTINLQSEILHSGATTADMRVLSSHAACEL